MTGALSSFLGGPQQPQNQNQNQGPSNTIDPNSILSGDFNPQDYLGSDPTYQAEQTVPAGATTDPSTGAPSSPGAGRQVADAGTSGDLGPLRNLIMSTAGQPQAGTPGIQRTPPAPGQQAAPGWFMNNRFGNWQTMRDASQSPTGTPVMGPGPDVPIPQPRPDAANAVNFNTQSGVIPGSTPILPANLQPNPGPMETGVSGAEPVPPPQAGYDPSQDPMSAGTAVAGPPANLPASAQANAPFPFTQNTGDLPIISPLGSDQSATATVGPVQTSPLAHEAAADVPMESGVSGAAKQQPDVANVPVKPAPAQQEQPEPAPDPQRQQPQPQFTPKQYMQQSGPELLRDFLQGGPRGLAMGLEDLIRQIFGGGMGNRGQVPPNAQWAPGFGPETGRYRATPQEIEQFRRSRSVPDSNFSGKTQPKTVTPTRETPPATPVNLPATAGAQLDPFTAGTTATSAPANVAGAAPRADWGGNYNIANRAIPAPIRFNNPGGAQAWSGSAKWGGQGNYSLVRHPGTGEMDKISHYPTPVHGAASNLDQVTSAPNYRGRRLGDAMRTWSGNMRATTGDRALDNLPATKETFQNPEVAIRFLTAMQRAEAGRVWMTRAQMLSAWQMWQAGSAQAYEGNLGRAA